MQNRICCLLAITFFLSLGDRAVAQATDAKPSSGQSQASQREAIDFFEKRIRPVLIEHCYACHSQQAQEAGKLKGGLLLDTRKGMRQGGDSGAAIEEGQPTASLLLESLRYGEDSYQMPPKGKLPDAIIDDFAKWIAAGAADPRTGEATSASRKIDWKTARDHWSFQKPKTHAAPNIKQTHLVRRKTDAFLLARLNQAQLSFAPPADRETLLRRACFDLHGLPPTAKQRQTFLNDKGENAFARLVDRLLKSPRYGERWARHWLDVARYAEDNTNMGPHNGPYPHAWRYRDWVVAALNDDMPYDQFVIRQLAVDFLPDSKPADMAALGFQGLAPSYHKEVALAKVVLENRYADEWEDRVDAIGRGLLGLTLACARCHDHKYDPVSSEDYYSLASVFASCRQTTRPVISAEEIAKTQPLRDQVAKLEKQMAARDKRVKELQKEVAELNKKIAMRRRQIQEEKTKSESSKTDPSPKQRNSEQTSKKQTNGDKKTAPGAKPDADAKPNADANDKATAEKAKTEPEEFDIPAATKTVAAKQADIAAAKNENAADKAQIAEIKKKDGFEIPVANSLTEEQVRVEEINKQRMKIVYYADKPRDLKIFIRGDAGRLGAQVSRGFLTLLSRSYAEGKRTQFRQGSGRLELAQAIASAENPLTARVIVNRVWQQHFGVGIVDSPSNFGATGSPPSHPKLLDDLSVRFMKQGWSLKWLHREIMNSSAYRQDSQTENVLARATDPDNRLLSRFPRRRLEAEAFRDAVLFVSGQLDEKMGGPSGDVDSADFKRRALYASVSRHKLSDTLQTFDFPDPAIHCAARSRTTTPLQEMFILNSPFMQKQAAALAARIQAEGGKTLEDRVRFAHRLLFAREAADAEIAIGRQFLAPNSGDSHKQPKHAKLKAPKPKPPTFSGGRIHARVASLANKPSYSFEIWFRNTMAHNKRPVTGYFFSRGKNAGGNDHGDHFGISGTSGGKPGRLMFYSGAPQRKSILGATQLMANNWRHAVLIRDHDKVILYLDGKRTAEVEGTAKWSFDRSITDVFLGGRRDNFANFEGQLQEAAIYDRPLSADEVAAHFAASGLPQNEHSHQNYAEQILRSKPLAYWPLSIDSPKSKRAVDISRNQNHAEYEQRAGGSQTPDAWTRYAHALLSSNEFLFVD